MAEERMPLAVALCKGEEPGGDWLADAVRALAQAVMDAEVSSQIGAAKHERSPERTTYRNGYRSRDWDTRLGTLELQIPKLRRGSDLPSWLEPRRRAEQALVGVVQGAYVNGISARNVDRLVEQMGVTGLSKDQVSRLCRGLDEHVRIFRERPLEGRRYPYLWLGREGGTGPRARWGAPEGAGDRLRRARDRAA